MAKMVVKSEDGHDPHQRDFRRGCCAELEMVHRDGAASDDEGEQEQPEEEEEEEEEED